MTAPNPMTDERRATLNQLARDLVREDILNTGGYQNLHGRSAPREAIMELERQLEGPSIAAQQVPQHSDLQEQRQRELDQLAKDVIREDILNTGGYENLVTRGASQEPVTELRDQLEARPPGSQQVQQQSQQVQQQKENSLAKLIRNFIEGVKAAVNSLLGRGGQQQAQAAPVSSPPAYSPSAAAPPPYSPRFEPSPSEISPPDAPPPYSLSADSPAPESFGPRSWTRSAPVMPASSPNAPLAVSDQLDVLDPIEQQYVAQAVNEFIKNDKALSALWNEYNFPASQLLLEEHRLDPTARDIPSAAGVRKDPILNLDESQRSTKADNIEHSDATARIAQAASVRSTEMNTSEGRQYSADNPFLPLIKAGQVPQPPQQQQLMPRGL
ncbi:hypothetical protein FKR81_41005 [Lentzea tibetensis]|uniref:Uncharacterized protein n=1 Tax=Lentzea tibetensis TaxID=2591470 RepID=A0A563EFK4_9PSEU|nr:hypothetical protein [Lentzea tibetensis]TWP44507.1 hypothetical protein FKR81_41005 [Lentzea tibetensis]